MKRTWYPGKWKALHEVQHLQRSQFAHTKTKMQFSIQTTWWFEGLSRHLKNISAAAMSPPSPFHIQNDAWRSNCAPSIQGCFPFTGIGTWWHHICHHHRGQRHHQWLKQMWDNQNQHKLGSQSVSFYLVNSVIRRDKLSGFSSVQNCSLWERHWH